MASGGRKTPPDASAPPEEVAAVTPRNLHPTSDIRFVMIEVGKLTANVDRLIADVKSHGQMLEKKTQAAAVEATKLSDRLSQVEGGVASLVLARGAPWWKRLEPANLLLAAVGLVTLLLTLILGNGRFEDVSKRLDTAEKHTEAVEQRANETEDKVSIKLDQIQQDLAVLKAERPRSPPP